MIQGDGYVIVESGDYLGTIANRVGVSVPKLQEMNGIANPDFIYVGQKLKTKEKIQEKPQEVKEESQKTTTEKVNEQREQTKDEDVKTSKETQCCPIIAPWKVLEFDEKGKQRTYELEIAKEAITNDGKKVAIEVVSEKQKVSEHNLYMIAPPVDNEGETQRKKMKVNFTFIHNPCNHVMVVRNETIGEKIELKSGAESEAIEAEFEINTEGHIEKSYFLAPRMYQPNATLGGVDAASEIKRIDGEISSYQNLNDPYAMHLITRLEEERKQYEAMLVQDSAYCSAIEESDATSQSPLILMLIKEFTGQDWRIKKISISPIGSKECQLQPKVNLYVIPYTELTGTFDVSFSLKHTTDGSVTQYKIDKKTGSLSIDGDKKLPNDVILINRGTMKISVSLTCTIGSWKRKFSSDTQVYNKLSNGDIENRNPKNIPEHNPKAQKAVKRKQATDMFSGFQSGVNSFYERLGKGKVGAFSYELGTTALQVKAKKWKYVEDDITHQCGFIGSLEIVLRVFDGAKIQADLVEIILSRAGPMSDKLIEWRKDLKEGQEFAGGKAKVQAKLEAYLGVSGGFKGGFSWGRKTVNEQFETAGIFNTYLGLDVGVKAEATATVLTVEGKAGVGVVAGTPTSKVISPRFIFELKATVDKNGEIDWTGKAYFTGATIYYMAYFHVKLVKDTKTKVDSKSTENNSSKNWGGKNGQFEMDEKIEQEVIKKEGTESQPLFDKYQLYP